MYDQPSTRGPGILGQLTVLMACARGFNSALSFVPAHVPRSIPFPSSFHSSEREVRVIIFPPAHDHQWSKSMAKEHQPGRIGLKNSKQANHPIPRVDKGPAGYTIGLGSTSDTNFEHLKPSPTTGEREGVTRQRFASSAADTQDGRRREKQPIRVGIFKPEEDAQASRHFNVTHRGSTAGVDPYRVPPLPLTGKDRDHISALDQERDRHKPYANINTTSYIPALSSSATYNPGYTAPANAPPVSAIIGAMKSVSFEDNGEQSNSSPKGWNGPSRPPPVSYGTRPSVPPPSIIRPQITNKSVSYDSGVQSSTSLNNRNGPSDNQDPYARCGVPPPPSSRPIINKKSVSLDSGVQSSTSFNYQNGPSDIQNSYTRRGAPLPFNNGPIITNKSVSLNSGVQSGTSLNDQNGPSDIQDSYARHGVPLPSSSNRPIVAKESVAFDSGGFQSGSSREGWTGPSRLPYENRYESSYSQETPKEVPQSWQSSNRLNSQHPLLDIASGSPYYPVRPSNTHYEVSEGEYHQTLNRSGNEVQRKELEMRRDKEEEAKRTENEVKMEEGRTQRMEGFTRHVENSRRRFGGEERRLVQDQTLQVAKRQEDEVRRKDEEARLKGETTRAMDEEFRRKAEEHNTQWQELHSLEDLTNKVQRRSSYPVASGGFGDIWKGDLVKHSRVFQVAVKTIRAFESDNNEVARKKANRVRRELKVWERLKHNSILPLWGVADDFGPYLAMVCPWADNGALTGFLERQQDKLSSQDKFALVSPLLQVFLNVC
ncbi:hypothetical protein F4604DRAFT_207905 [Suillus subluteus]|nr:hypothetical protein F4604DRAFT_207905 [Suillus subluteus]